MADRNGEYGTLQARDPPSSSTSLTAEPVPASDESLERFALTLPLDPLDFLFFFGLVLEDALRLRSYAYE